MVKKRAVKAGKPKPDQITIRFAPGERQRFEDHAEKERRPLGDWFRVMAVRGIEAGLARDKP